MAETIDTIAPSLRDEAIEVLRGTRDGDALSSSDLALLQAVVNAGSLQGLSEWAQERWPAIVADVRSDSYVRPWFHDIENLTKDHEGYVLWRGKSVEHYSFPEKRRDAEKIAAQKLAAACLRLECDSISPTTTNLFAFWDRMRRASELGASTPRFIVVWNACESSLDLRVRPLVSETDEALVQEIDKTTAKLGVDRTGRKVHQLLVTQEDFDSVCESIARTADYCRSAASRRGEHVAPNHSLYDEPNKSLAVLASIAKRESLATEAQVDRTYLGIAPKYVAAWKSTGPSLDLRVLPLTGQDIRSALGPDSSGKEVRQLLETQDDYDRLEENISRSIDMRRAEASRANSGMDITRDDPLYPEPDQSLALLASLVKRDDLASSPAPRFAHGLDPAPAQAGEVAHERAK